MKLDPPTNPEHSITILSAWQESVLASVCSDISSSVLLKKHIQAALQQHLASTVHNCADGIGDGLDNIAIKGLDAVTLGPELLDGKKPNGGQPSDPPHEE